MIVIKNRQRKYLINERLLKKRIRLLLVHLGYSDFDITVWLTTNKTIACYNQAYRDKSGPTDILSFAYHTHVKPGQKIIAHDPDEKNLGGIIISLEFVYTHKRWQEVPEHKRLDILIVHGICHLLGYNHETDADYRKMHKKEQELLEVLDKE